MKNNYLALGGLFACLHVLFLLLSKVIVGSELLLVLFLPLLSTIYTLKCDKRNTVMFVISTVLVCSIFDVVCTFVYVVPSLVCGILYGVLRKNKFKELELLCITSIGHIFSLLFSFFVISLIFKEIKFMDIFANLFGLFGNELLVVSFYFLSVLGFCEAFLVHVVSDNELEKFISRVEKNDVVPGWFKIGFIISLLLFFVLYFVNDLFSVFPLLFVIMFIVPYIVYGVINLKYKKMTFTLVLCCFFISILLLKILNPLNYLIIPLFIVSPFSINNFKDIKEKNF